MGHYIKTFVEENQAWLATCRKTNAELFNVGDTIKLTDLNTNYDRIIRKGLLKHFGEKTYKVDEVIKPKWELMPCEQYLILSGISGMFLNTIFTRG